MTSTLPQSCYFKNTFTLPGTAWKISGHSRALERTGFSLTGGGATILLDAGVDLPDMSHPDVILITHTHIDHCNALPMLARYTVTGAPMHIFVPGPVLQRLREFVSLSFSMKVDEGDVVPDHYTSPPPFPPPPPELDVISDTCSVEPLYHPWEASIRRWYPVKHSQQIPLKLGKGGNKMYVVETVQLMHTVSTVGYIVYERRTKIFPEVMKRLESECKNKRDLGNLIQKARASGEVIEYYKDICICAFICDTSAEALKSGLHASRILAAPVVIIECTYLEESFTAEANRRGHVVWAGEAGLCNVVRERIFPTTQTDDDNGTPSGSVATFILMHFSLRYSDTEIVKFFLNPEAVQLGSAVATAGAGPPHVVLWLDTGIVQLWYQA